MSFKPMLCEKADIEQVEEGLFDDGVWLAQKKYDGIRAYVKQGKIYSRSGRDITEKFPELHAFLKEVADTKLILDGEIVSALTEEFNDVSGRVHLKDKLFIRMASKGNPAKYVLFDCIQQEKVSDELHTCMDRQRLVAVHIALTTKVGGEYPIEIAENSGTPSELLDRAKREGWEGIVLKKRDSLYNNRRSFDWRKVKLFKETQHSFSNYDDHPKGVLLIDGDRKVNVNGQQAEAVKRAIKENGSVKVEVQYLPQNGSQKWRFPSFRGIVKEDKQ